jgi:hypothetical protein
LISWRQAPSVKEWSNWRRRWIWWPSRRTREAEEKARICSLFVFLQSLSQRFSIESVSKTTKWVSTSQSLRPEAQLPHSRTSSRAWWCTQQAACWWASCRGHIVFWDNGEITHIVLEHEFLTLYTTTIASSSVFFFCRIDQPVAILAYQVVQKKEWDLQFDSKALLQIPKLQFLSEECENCSNIVKK